MILKNMVAIFFKNDLFIIVIQLFHKLVNILENSGIIWGIFKTFVGEKVEEIEIILR